LTERSSSRKDLAYGLGLFFITLASRVPFRSRILYHWDSVNFANAMRHFDMLNEHPQPPGYIVYVWLCRLVDLLFRDANATMVWISVLASGLSVVMLYNLGRAMWDRRVGLVAALFLASSPLFWFYGEIALPHALDTFLVLLSISLLHRIHDRDDRVLWPTVLLLAFAGGVRQQTLVFLLPLALYALSRVGWQRILLSGLLGAAMCLVWLVPLVTSCGGIGVYLAKMSSFSARFQRSTSILMGAGWLGIVRNLRKLGMYTAYAMGSTLLPLGVHVLTRSIRRRWPERWNRVAFLAIWVAPALLFYSLIHMGQQGLVFVFLPALLLLGAVATVRLTRDWGRRAWAGVTLLVVANTIVFCLAPEYPLGPGTQRLLTRATLVNSDRRYGERFAAIREHFPPESTAVIALEWAHPEYYLPEYALLRVDQIVPGGEKHLAFRGWPGVEGMLSVDDLGLESESDGEAALVLFDAELETLVQASQLRKVVLPSSGELSYLSLRAGEVLAYGPGALLVREEGD